MNYAIEASSLAKRYAVNRSSAGTVTFRDAVSAGVRGLLKTSETDLSEHERHMPQDYWALQDVSFTVHEGERVGIIGPNGAGKSTLLKVLSRITKPTLGRVAIRGSVASLLEVGTGFHPELSGRENVYLNGAILGMSHREIRQKFDKIVAFSGVEKFLDTPVKHYSSGMYVRLAFSVAAWLEPDILVVDEVLAVGDQAFQRKCAERMQQLTSEGRTVIVVSHSMTTVNAICDKALHLQGGRVVAFGPVKEVTEAYIRRVMDDDEGGTWLRPKFVADNPSIRITGGSRYAHCVGGSVETIDGEVADTLSINKPFKLCLSYRLVKSIDVPVVPNFHVYDEEGRRFFISMPANSAPREAGPYTAHCVIPPFLMNTGRYMVGMALSSYDSPNPIHFDAQFCLRFQVIEPVGADDRRHGYGGTMPGLSRPRLDWQVVDGARHAG